MPSKYKLSRHNQPIISSRWKNSTQWPKKMLIDSWIGLLGLITQVTLHVRVVVAWMNGTPQKWALTSSRQYPEKASTSSKQNLSNPRRRKKRNSYLLFQVAIKWVSTDISKTRWKWSSRKNCNPTMRTLLLQMSKRGNYRNSICRTLSKHGLSQKQICSVLYKVLGNECLLSM